MRRAVVKLVVPHRPLPATCKETLAPHIAAAREKGAAYLFESSWKKPYSGRTSHTSLEISGWQGHLSDGP